MTLNELYNLFDQAIKQTGGQYIDLSQALVDPLKDVLSPLELDTLRVTSPKLGRTPSSVTLTGSAGYRQQNCNLILAATEEADIVFLLTLAIISDLDWTLAKVFNHLPDYYAFQDGVLKPTPSFLNETVITQPAFISSAVEKPEEGLKQGLNLRGNLLMEGPLSPYTVFYGEGPFSLQGPMELQGDQSPIFELDAAVYGHSVPVGGTRLDNIGLRLAVRYDNDQDAEDWPEQVSVLEATGTIYLGDQNPIRILLAASLLEGDFVWAFRAEFSDYSELIKGGLTALASAFFGVPAGELVLPDGLSFLSSIYLSEVGVGLTVPEISMRANDTLGISYLYATIQSNEVWKPPIPFISLSKVGANWNFIWYDDPLHPMIQGTIYGTFNFGKTEDMPADTAERNTGFSIEVSATVPDFLITGRLSVKDEIDLGEAFSWFFGSPGPLTDLKIVDLEFTAGPFDQSFYGEAVITTGWNLQLGDVNFNLAYLYMMINSSQNSLSAGITGALMIDDQYNPEGLFNRPDGTVPTCFLISAFYSKNGDKGGWLFEGHLHPGSRLDLIALVRKFLSIPDPHWLPTLTIEKLAASFNTSTSEYTFAGTINGRWKIEGILDGIDLSVTAGVDLAHRKKSMPADNALVLNDNDMVLVGKLFGKFMVNRFFVSVGMNLKETESTYLFSISYGDVELSGATSWLGDAEHRHQVINFTLNGVSLGSLLTYFVNLARPGSDFKLDPPWDFLNSISLSRFTLTVDPTDSWVSLTYKLNLNLVFVDIEDIGVKYISHEGTGSVRLVIKGRFLDQEYDDGHELEWDVVDDPAPAVPGEGEQLFRLRYLGLGQHVLLKNAASYESVDDVIEALRDQMKPVTDNSRNPLDQPSGSLLIFDENSHWLIGLDIEVMSTVSLAVVFNDPAIYGLVVSLGGSQAGSLAGLRFEILYKRITDSLGVFKAEIRIPEAFRQWQFGVVSVTLGVIAVEIYTNGDFKIDLGFPKGRDFSDSFNLQVYYFIGHGGIYFGKLNGATSSKVPVVTNGNFSPVLELGIGLAVGVGREFNKGPLKAGLYVELVGIFEGVLAWFHSNDAAREPSIYYWVRAVAGIIGKLYGCVDFKVIKVSVSVEAYATVTLVLESYNPTIVELDVGVEVKASIKILFIRIHFSFGMNLHASFTIGEKSATPWQVASSASQPSLNGYRHSNRRSHLETRALTRMASNSANSLLGGYPRLDRLRDVRPVYALEWGSDPVFPDQKVHNVSLKLIPAFTIAGIDVQYQETASGNTDPQYKIIYLLTAENGIDPDAIELEDVRRISADRSAHASDIASLSLNVLIEAMFRWAVSAMKIGITADISSGQLEYLYDQLDLPDTSRAGFNLDTLSEFFTHNLLFQIAAVPEGPSPDKISGVIFPMIPLLSCTSDQLQGIDFTTYNPVGATYQQGIDQYFKDIMMKPPSAGGDDLPAGNGVTEPTCSMAATIFSDYFLLLTKTVVQSALDCLESYSYTLTATDSLDCIAKNPLFKSDAIPYIIKTGDTPDTVAAYFGFTTLELNYLNPDIAQKLAGLPGSAITVNIGVTPQSIGIANQNTELTGNTGLSLGDIPYQIEAGATLASIADRFNLSDVSRLITTDLIRDAGLLKTGNSMQVGPYTYSNPNNLPVDLVSAILYTRLNDQKDIPYQPWYTEFIFKHNDKLKSYGEVLPAGVELVVPQAYNDYPLTETYTTLPQDTLRWIGAYLSLQQNFNADQDPSGDFGKFNAAVRGLNPGGTGPVHFPDDMKYVLQPLETLVSLAQRLFITDIMDLVTIIKSQSNLLAERALITIPDVTYTTKAGDTLITVAGFFNLGVADLCGRPGVNSQAGLFRLDAELNQTIKIPDVPKMNIKDIVDALLEGETHSKVSGMTSRFFLHGLRLPAPEQKGPTDPITATGPMTGLYQLTGQQVPGLVPESVPVQNEDKIRATIHFKKEKPVDWIAFYESATLASFNELRAMNLPAEDIHALNPGLMGRNEVNGRMIVLTRRLDTDNDQTLDLTIREEDLHEGYPDTCLKPHVKVPLAPMKLFDFTPISYGLQHGILWQAAVLPSLPAEASALPLTGSPVIRPFTDTLNARIGNAGEAAIPYQLIYDQAKPDALPSTLTGYAWGTLVKVAIRRIRQSENQTAMMKNTYEIIGLDQAGKQLVYRLLQQLAVRETADDKVYLMYDTGSNSPVPTGFSSDAVDDSNTYILKTNLTTETADNNLLMARASNEPPLSGKYFAALLCPRAFLTLLWECSVIGGGYYLNYSGTGNAGLPDSIFAQDGNGQLWLVFLYGPQSAGSLPDRKLYSFNNCAVLGVNLDDGTGNVFVEAANNAEVTKNPTLKPGNLGFDMMLYNPEITPPGTAAQLTAQQLYSLMGYKLIKDTGNLFIETPEALPASPTEAGDPGETARDRMLRRKQRRAGIASNEVLPYWHLEQVLPVAKFAARHPLPLCPPLPDPGDDPYAGVLNGAKAPLAVWFTDVFGNVSQGYPQPSNDAAVPSLLLASGYTDPMIGLGKWPAVASNYLITVSPQPSVAVLKVESSFDAASFLPGMTRTLAMVQEQAAQQTERYQSIYYQCAQPDVRFALRTSLSQNPGSQPDMLPVDKTIYQRFAAAAYLTLQNIRRLLPVTANTAQTPTLESISADYGVSYAELAAVNGDRFISDLFGAAQVETPLYITSAFGDSARSLTRRLAEQGVTIQPVDLLLLDNNTILSLNPGTVLSITRTPVPGVTTPLSLEQAAAAALCSVTSYAAANADLTGWLKPGCTLSYQGLSLTVEITEPDGPTQSFNMIARRFITELNADSRTTGVMIAAANTTRDDIFQPDVTTYKANYVVQRNDTLLSNHSGCSKENLAALNTDTVNLFSAGAAVYYGAKNRTPQGTLNEFCHTYNLVPEQLFYHLRQSTLTTTGLAIPGAVQLPPETGTLYNPYSVAAGDSLQSLTGIFSVPGASSQEQMVAIARANLTMPGLFTGGQTITVDGASVTTLTGDTIQAILDRFTTAGHPVTLEQLVASIGERTDLLQDEAFLIMGLARVPSTYEHWKLSSLAALYHTDLAPFAAMNAALFGIIAAGVTLSVTVNGATHGTPSTQTYQVQTRTGDTLNSIVSRFNTQIPTSLTDVVLSNQDIPLIKAGVQLLLPPANACVSVLIGAGGNRFPSAVFPLNVSLEISRDAALIHPDFSDNEPTRMDRTVIPPVTGRSAGSNDPMRIAEFARAFREAIPMLKLATGKPGSVLETGDTDDGRSDRDLWAVVFTDGGISKIDIKAPVHYQELPDLPLPRYYALRPLENKLSAQKATPFRALKDDGSLGDPLPVDYQGIDLEVWARKFLADFDLFLTAPYTVPLWSLNGGALRATLDSLIEAKDKLSQAIAQGLTYVLNQPVTDGPAANDDPALQSARAQLIQRLKVSLSKAYSTDVILQYDSHVIARGFDKPARLAGHLTADTPAEAASGTQPKFAFGNAKTALTTDDDYVNFLLNVVNETLQELLDLQLTYNYQELEFDIEKTEGICEYEASNWLTFINGDSTVSADPSLSINLGRAVIPLPLRSYPELPRLVSQTTEAAYSGGNQPASIAQAKEWNYNMIYEHQDAAQDLITLTLRLNQPYQASTTLQGSNQLPTLMQTLGQYINVADKLWSMLERLLTVSGIGLEENLQNAVATFASLALDISESWQRHWLPGVNALKANASPQTQIFDYSVRLVPDQQGRYYSGLNLCYNTVLPWPGVNPPDIIVSADGKESVTLSKGQPVSGILTYTFPEVSAAQFPVNTRLLLKLTFSGLDIMNQQNGVSLVGVIRNRDLLKINGSAGQITIPTNRSFIYETPMIAFPGIATPLLTWNIPFPFGASGGLVSAIRDLFSQILGTPVQETDLSVAIQYGYTLVPATAESEALVVTMPVLFKPRFRYTDDVVQELANAMNAWNSWKKPNPCGGFWNFAINAFSSIDGSPQLPILSLNRLTTALRSS